MTHINNEFHCIGQHKIKCIMQTIYKTFSQN